MKKLFIAAILCLPSTLWAATSDDLVKQGEAALAAKDVAGAMKAFDAAIDSDPKNARANYDRGRINLVLHKNKNAVADFTSAIIADPTMALLIRPAPKRKLL